MPASRATSYRLDPELKDRLAAHARSEGISERALLERLIDEGLVTTQHPGIVFRGGPAGRRAGLSVGADVWEVISALRYTSGTDEERVADLSEQFGLHPRHIRTAIDFAARYRESIDAQVRANDEAAAEAQRVAEERARLMAG